MLTHTYDAYIWEAESIGSLRSRATWLCKREPVSNMYTIKQQQQQQQQKNHSIKKIQVILLDDH